MGLFDSLKKGLDTINKEAGKYKDDLQRELDKFSNQVQSNHNAQPAQPQYSPQQQYQQSQPDSVYPDVVNPQADRFADFDDIISRNFADYEVRRNMPASELMADCHPACTPVQFMFFRDGAPVLAVVLVRTNNYRGMNVLGTKRICDAKGIRYIRFYHEYENTEEYVVNRIRENLK